MPPKKDNRVRITLWLHQDWLDTLTTHSASEGVDRSTLLRSFVSECMSRRKLSHTPDCFGVFERKWRRTKPEIKRARKAEYMRRYRAKLIQKRLAKQPPKPITWTFHPSGQITTSDLDLLATFVGIIDASGTFQPESTRYSKDRVLSELRKLADQVPLPDPRYDEFLRLNPL